MKVCPLLTWFNIDPIDDQISITTSESDLYPDPAMTSILIKLSRHFHLNSWVCILCLLLITCTSDFTSTVVSLSKLTGYYLIELVHFVCLTLLEFTFHSIQVYLLLIWEWTGLVRIALSTIQNWLPTVW